MFENKQNEPVRSTDVTAVTYLDCNLRMAYRNIYSHLCNTKIFVYGY